MTHKAHSLTVHVDGMATAVHLPDIVSHTLTSQPTVERNVPSFGKRANQLSLTHRQVTGQIEVMSIEETLDAIGLEGLCVTSSENPGLRLNVAKFEPCGDIAAGSVHRGYLFRGGKVVPTRLTVDHRGDARLTLEVFPISVGGNDLVSLSDSLALPSITIESARWTLGPIEVGGIELTKYTNLDINFGNVVEQRGVQSNIDDEFIEVHRVEPEIMIRGIDPEWFSAASIPWGGLLCTHANTEIFLRKRDPDGVGFIADNVAEHLKFTLSGVAKVQQVTGSQEDRYSETGLILYAREDDSANAGIQFAGEQTIGS